MPSINTHYQSPSRQPWQGRTDGPDALRIHECIELHDLPNSPASNLEGSIGLLGFACDEGVRRNKGRCGAANGPYAIRCALASLPIPKSDRRIIDCGNILCNDGNLETAQQQLAEATAMLLSQKI